MLEHWNPVFAGSACDDGCGTRGDNATSHCLVFSRGSVEPLDRLQPTQHTWQLILNRLPEISPSRDLSKSAPLWRYKAQA